MTAYKQIYLGDDVLDALERVEGGAQPGPGDALLVALYEANQVRQRIQKALGITPEPAPEPKLDGPRLTREQVVAIMRDNWQDPAGFHTDVADALSIDEREYDPVRAWRYELKSEVVEAAARVARYFEDRGPVMASSNAVVDRDRDIQLIARAIADSHGEAIRDTE